VFGAFGELALVERAELKLMALCTAGAAALTCALQYALG